MTCRDEDRRTSHRSNPTSAPEDGRRGHVAEGGLQDEAQADRERGVPEDGRHHRVARRHAGDLVEAPEALGRRHLTPLRLAHEMVEGRDLVEPGGGAERGRDLEGSRLAPAHRDHHEGREGADPRARRRRRRSRRARAVAAPRRPARRPRSARRRAGPRRPGGHRDRHVPRRSRPADRTGPVRSPRRIGGTDDRALRARRPRTLSVRQAAFIGVGRHGRRGHLLAPRRGGRGGGSGGVAVVPDRRCRRHPAGLLVREARVPLPVGRWAARVRDPGLRRRARGRGGGLVAPVRQRHRHRHGRGVVRQLRQHGGG